MKIGARGGCSLPFKLLSLVVYGMILTSGSGCQPAETRLAQGVIQKYTGRNQLEIHPGTEAYKIFMRSILWGEHPALTDLEAGFLTSQAEREAVLNYAWKHSGYQALYGKYDEPEIQEALPPPEMEPE